MASDLDRADQRAYVERVFAWYHHREQVFLVGVTAGVVGVAVATGQTERPIVAGALLVLLVAVGYLVQIVVAPLHREYLCCLVLLERLIRFREPLKQAFEEIGQPGPEPGTYLRFYGSWFTDGTRLAEAIRARDRKCKATLGPDEDRTAATLGRYLFAVLAHVPTDEYERRRPVRVATDEIIRGAALIRRRPMMLPILTERLQIRPYRLQDVEPIHKVLYGDAQARRLTGGVSDLDNTRATIERYIERGRVDGYSFWAVLERDSGELVGEAGLKPLEDRGPDVELGYSFGPASWGQGYATEAGRAILDAAFGPLELHQVVAVTREDNSGSQRVLAKLGFVPAGRRHAYGDNLLYFALEREPRPGADPQQSP